MLHETFHIHFDEQTPTLKHTIEGWFNKNPSANSRYAYSLFNESVVTSMAQGHVYIKLTDTVFSRMWYNNKYINEMARKIYPLVKTYIDSTQAMDEAFVNSYIKIFDDHYASWTNDIFFIMTGRYALTDKAENIQVLNNTYRHSSMFEAENSITNESIQKLVTIQLTQLIIVTEKNVEKLKLIKTNIPALNNWEPDGTKDFSYSIWNKQTKTWLIITNCVNKTFAEQIKDWPEQLPFK
jgi:hypothetical protein